MPFLSTPRFARPFCLICALALLPGLPVSAQTVTAPADGLAAPAVTGTPAAPASAMPPARDPAAVAAEAAAAQAAAMAEAEAQAEARRAVVAAEIARLAAEREAARLAAEAAAAAEAGRAAQAEAEARAQAELDARRAIIAAEIARLAAEREAARLAAEAAAAAEAGRAAQAEAEARAQAELDARRAVIAAEIARLAAEREAARAARAAAEAASAACMETVGPATAEVPVSAAAQAASFDRLRAGLAACQEAVALAPDAGGPLFHMATVAQARGQHAEARALYDRAAAAGVGAAQTRLGDYHNFGIGGLRADVDRAVAAYRAATDLGDPAGMATLAFMYRLGRGVPRDSAEMIRLFRTAADEGYHFAQLNLGQAYLTGDGIPGGADPALGIPDPRAAVPLLAAAARGGNMDAALTLARLYGDGADGVPANPASRLRWTRVAAAAGHPPAIAALAYLREQGIGAPRDPVAAALGYVAALETGAVEVADLRAAGGPRPPAWDRQAAIEFQLILQERGLYLGAIDGLVGPGTLGAARALAN